MKFLDLMYLFWADVTLLWHWSPCNARQKQHLHASPAEDRCLFAVLHLQYNLLTTTWVIGEDVQGQWACKEAVMALCYINRATRTSFPACLQTFSLLFIAGKDPITKCSLHRKRQYLFLFISFFFSSPAHTVSGITIMVSICIYTLFCNSKLSHSSY